MSSLSYQVPVGQRQLFLDDVSIAASENLTRTMHQPRKLGAVIRPDPSIGISSHQTRTAPVWDPNEGIFKLLTLGRPDDMTLNACSYFESKDGLHWTKPSLRQIEHQGSLDNNYLLVDTGAYQLAPHLFVRDPEDPDPARQYKGATLFHRRIDRQTGEPAVGFFTSLDARSWKVLDCPRVRSSDEYNMSYDPTSNQFILTVKQRGTQGGRAVWLSTSQDFEHWTEPELIFEADEQDQELGRQNIKDRLFDDSLHRPLYNDEDAYNVDVYNMGVMLFHSKAGTLRGIMAHISSSKVFSLKFNGIEVGEIGSDAAIAGYFGVPVTMVTGDKAACNEAHALLGNVETVAVKEGVSRSSGLCIQPAEARKLIKEGAKRAMSLVGTAKPFVIEPPIHTEIVFIDPTCADNLEYLPFIERIDGRTVTYTTDDFIEAFELYYMLQSYGGSVK